MAPRLERADAMIRPDGPPERGGSPLSARPGLSVVELTEVITQACYQRPDGSEYDTDGTRRDRVRRDRGRGREQPVDWNRNEPESCR